MTPALLAATLVAFLDFAGIDGPLVFNDIPALVPAKSAPPAMKSPPTSWSRTDSRGVRWTHADRAYLDSYVDGIERSYAGAGGIYTTPGANYTAAGATCVGGSCGVPSSSFRLFGRR